ncbi:MAG: HD domain-containing protein [Syntrophales bacterium]|nr:HD domain-containing protein [Syntrophales bacterium]MDD5640263.1 HD domain-containing protein [Syntrophales bacterium]
MPDEEKTREQLLEELAALRRELEDIQAYADPEWRRLEKWRQSFGELQKMLAGVLQVLEGRDPDLVGHHHRVTQLACAIAGEMDLTPEQIEGLSIAAMVHDIGKVFIPPEVLTKTGSLTPLETTLVQAHPQAGYNLLQNLDFSQPVAQMVLQHHERLDGSGYPARLKGQEILLEARILGVSDVVEAMVYARPYRLNLGINQALAEISRNRGRLYDPEVVDACLGLFDKGFDFL